MRGVSVLTVRRAPGRWSKHSGCRRWPEGTVLIKPNFNTADPPPGSTHNDTLETVIRMVQEGGPKQVIVGDRSGPANTREVFQEKGIFQMGERLGFECLIFDEHAQVPL